MLLSPRMHAWRLLSFCLALAAASCASVPVATVVPPAPAPPPDITPEEKLAWVIRLEDQRILKDPSPPPPAMLQPATLKTPAVYALPAPSDLIPMLSDPEGRVRRRAALAVGRVGLVAGVEPLLPLLADTDVEVRQMAAFALGLIGHQSARAALIKSLDDPEPIVQGRAAEALGSIGNRADADAVSGIVRRQIAAGALNGIEPDDLSYPLAAPAEAARLAIYALVRLGSYDALAAAVLDGSGQPVSRWWPVAYALGRINDQRAAPVLLTLLNTPGRYTAAFSARGLAGLKAPQAAAALRQIVDARTAHPAILIQAVRGLGALADPAALATLVKIVADRSADTGLRLEAATSIGTLAAAEHAELLIDLLMDPLAGIRGAALRALARVEPDVFIATLAGMEPDRDWSVRVAEAAALGTLPGERSLPRLRMLLDDRDQRVVPPAIEALAASKPQGFEKILLEKLQADDFAVRAAAATALGELKSASAIPALLEAYKIALGDVTYGARDAMLTAINAIEPATGRQMLQQALTDKDWALRLRAAAILRQGGATDVDATMRPAPSDIAADDQRIPALVNPKYSPHAFIETDKGTIEIELAVLDAPLTVDNFVTLARKGYFNGLVIHRVVPDFVVQDGDPRGDGEGGPGYTIRDEINQRPYLRGTVGMALAGKDTGGSQFFITHSPQPHLDARYTVFGHVVSGMDVVDRIAQGDIVRSVRIWDGVTASQ
jgi:cyclophilin family peptidyl-prolyl cis-trans isomerase/HEAT repeat protein